MTLQVVIGVVFSNGKWGLLSSVFSNYTEEQLFEEIAKIGGMSDVSHMKAYQALTGDMSAARAFLVCPIDSRKLWLSVKFGPTFFYA